LAGRAAGVAWPCRRANRTTHLPTVADFVPGYEVSAWFGVGVAGTPTEVIERLNKAINEAFADPKMMARLADLGGTALPGSPADFGKLIADETDKWGKVVNQSTPFATTRAREDFPHSCTSRATGVADTDRASSPGGLSAFGGGRKDPEITRGCYPTTPLANRGEILSPRLTRLGSGAREALRLLGPKSDRLGVGVNETTVPWSVEWMSTVTVHRMSTLSTVMRFCVPAACGENPPETRWQAACCAT
jgi:Tripartite tricarboxylate transporter family receptor